MTKPPEPPREKAEKDLKIFPSTHRRFRMLAAEWGCSIAEAADRCSKLAASKK